MQPFFEDKRQEAKRCLYNATQLDASKHYVEAEECYTRGILMLRDVIRDPSLPSAEKHELMNYISDVAKRVQLLRTILRDGESGRRAQQQQQQQRAPSVAGGAGSTPPPPEQMRSTGASDDYLAALDDYARDGALHKTPSTPPAGTTPALPVTQPTPPPSKDTAAAVLPPVPSDFLATPELTTPSGDGGPPRAVRDIDGAVPPPNRALRERFAPRASDFVLKAIDVAQRLTLQDELKRAVDVLQHAYQVGCREKNIPGNFGLIKDTLRLMRQKYYTKNPPKFLQDNPLHPAEMEVLRRSGITSTILLPMWDDVSEGYGAENVFMPCAGVWCDAFSPKLAKEQREHGAQLMHVADLWEGRVEQLAIVRQVDPMSIEQSVVGDCSMVSSLIMCASFQKRFPNATIISNVIYPQDKAGNPIVNPKGKYCVKMLINGMTRIVTIDDRLPANPRTRRLLCTRSADPLELWPSLMEKAFVKVCGGSYEFPGSTSSTDLYKLSGWLPSSLALHGDDMDPDYQWRRLCQGIKDGAVLLSVTTAEPVPKCAGADAGLAENHCFAVLDMREVEAAGQTLRVLQIRNPWSKRTWTGALSATDTSEAAAKVHKVFDYTEEAAKLGVFLITWEDTIRYFDRISLSWNPYALYRTAQGLPRRPTRLACHSTFAYTTAMGSMPQLHIGVFGAPRVTRMHLVFSRHIHDVEEFHADVRPEGPSAIPCVALQVFDVTAHPSVAQCIGGRCVFGMCYCRRLASLYDLTERMEPLNDPIYRSQSAFTVSFDCPAGSPQLLVVVKRLESEAMNTFSFSVTLHTELDQMRLPSSSALVASESLGDFNNHLENANTEKGSTESGVFMHIIPPTSLKHTSRTSGEWVSRKSCGGRSDASTLVYNPQYLLTLSKPALISAKLTTEGTKEGCQLLLCRKAAPLAEGGGSGTGRVRPPLFAHRVGSVSNGEVDLLMCSKLYSCGGSCVDSALPDTLALDTSRILGNRPRRVARKLRVDVVASPGGAAFVSKKGKDSFTMYNIEDTDEVSAVLLEALKLGFPASLAHSTLMVNDTVVLPTAPLRSVFDVAGGVEAEELVTVQHCWLALNTPDVMPLMPLQPTHPAAPLLESIQEVLQVVHTRSSQARVCVVKLNNLLRRVNTAEPPITPPALRAYLASLCIAGMELVKRVLARAGVRSTAPAQLECLPPLPAGDYTLIASLWKKGTPGRFVLTVETTEPHTVTEIPPEGEGLVEKFVKAEMIPMGTRLQGSLQKMRIIPKTDTYFLNSKVSIQLASRGVFTCRLILLSDADSVEQEGRSGARAAYGNVSLFKVRDATSMEMVATSGDYVSRGGISIPLLTLDGHTQYLAVVSDKSASSAEYLLRMYSSSAFTAQLTQ